jgi:uncharacterized protein (TIGR02996 family)
MASANDIWTEQHVKDLSPDEKSIPAAREVLKKGGFGTVEPTADGKGWWVVCRGITGTYQVSARRKGSGFDCECNCPSPKYPCKHALALLFYLVEHSELRVEKEETLPAASDFEGLVRALFHNPDDDTPRLIFADWLEENGQIDRAALIRYQCEQARYKSNAKRHKELDKLIKPLVEKLKKAMRPLPAWVKVEFRRGFLRVDGRAIEDAAALPTRFVDLFLNGWVETLVAENVDARFGRARGALALAEHVGELDASAHPTVREEALLALAGEARAARAAGRLARVKVHKRDAKAFARLEAVAAGTAEPDAPADLPAVRTFNGVAPGAFDMLLRTGHFDGATELSVFGRYGDAEAEALTRADLSELAELRLAGADLTARGTTALANSAQLLSLRRLGISGGTFDEGGFAALVSGTAFARVEELTLGSCELTDAHLEALARSTAFPSLGHLDLFDNAALTAKGASALLGSKNFPKLHRVEFPLLKEHAELIPLVRNAAPRPSLEVQFVGFDVYLEEAQGEVRLSLETGAQYLKGIYDNLPKCPAARRVTHFSADGTAAGVEDVRAIAAGLSATALKSLRFAGCGIGNDGATALAEAFAQFDLRELALRNCRVQAAGTVALVKSPLFARLEVLDLTGSTPGKAGVAALLNADVPPNLRELRVLRLDAANKAKLKKKYGKALKG